MMKPEQNKLTATAVSIALLLLILIALAATGQVQAVIIRPVLSAASMILIILQALPQVAVWALFVLFSFILFSRSFMRTPAQVQARQIIDYQPNTGRLHVIRQWLYEASFGAFFRRRLIRHLAVILLEAKGYPSGLTNPEMLRIIEKNELQLPQDVRDYLIRGFTNRSNGYSPSETNLIKRLLERFMPQAEHIEKLDPELLGLVSILEKELEISNEHGH